MDTDIEEVASPVNDKPDDLVPGQRRANRVVGWITIEKKRFCFLLLFCFCPPPPCPWASVFSCFFVFFFMVGYGRNTSWGAKEANFFSNF